MKKLLLAGVTLLSIGVLAPASAQQGTSPTTPNAAVAQKNINSAQPSRDEIMQAQRALEQKGFNAGKADGILGPETKAALIKFQEQQKLQKTGQLDNATLSALGVSQGTTSTTGQGSSQQMGNSQSHVKQPASGTSK